jgi:acyl carrier protein
MSDAVAETVLSILAKVKRIPREKLSIDSDLQALGLDSLDTIVLLSELEDQFKIAISDDDARSIHSVRDIVEGVKKLAGNLPMNSPASAD